MMVVSKLFGLIVLLYTIKNTNGHGSMTKPNNWFDHKKWLSKGVFDYVGMKPGLQCFSGCDYRGDEICPNEPHNCVVPYPGCSCMWHMNYTFIEKQTLFDPKLRTYLHAESPTYVLKHPWLAPGSAHIDSPCGVGGGNINGCNGECTQQGGYPKGPKAEEFFSTRSDYKTTTWLRGSVEEVAWGISANHGGGYSYRLCKVPEQGIVGVTEDCFQKTPLKFAGDKQWVQYGEDEKNRFEFEAVRTDLGTTPKGSQWTKNPIPACNGLSGGYFATEPFCPQGTQYPSPRKDLSGFGTNVFRNLTGFQFSIVDKVFVPTALGSGDYVLSFRWDCEQTPQVWNTCASIRLE